MVVNEWWIEDAFSVTACDGDIGDLHHECVVLIRACSELVDTIHDLTDWTIKNDYDGDYQWLKEDILNASECDDPEEFLVAKGMDAKVWDRAMNDQQTIVSLECVTTDGQP